MGVDQPHDRVVDKIVSFGGQIRAGHQVVFMGIESSRQQNRIGGE